MSHDRKPSAGAGDAGLCRWGCCFVEESDVIAGLEQATPPSLCLRAVDVSVLVPFFSCSYLT